MSAVQALKLHTTPHLTEKLLLVPKPRDVFLTRLISFSVYLTWRAHQDQAPARGPFTRKHFGVSTVRSTGTQIHREKYRNTNPCFGPWFSCLLTRDKNFLLPNIVNESFGLCIENSRIHEPNELFTHIFNVVSREILSENEKWILEIDSLLRNAPVGLMHSNLWWTGVVFDQATSTHVVTWGTGEVFRALTTRWHDSDCLHCHLFPCKNAPFTNLHLLTWPCSYCSEQQVNFFFFFCEEQFQKPKYVLKLVPVLAEQIRSN